MTHAPFPMKKSRLLRSLFLLVGGAALVYAGYEVYVELGGSAGDRLLRQRGCVLCHAAPEELPAWLRSWRPGQPLKPLLAERLRQVHPRLSEGAEEELAELCYLRLLPLLEQKHAALPGQALYFAKCAACHGKNGSGQAEEYPPLDGSEWITAEPSRLPEILTQGLHEPITVKGKEWNKTMRAPGLSSPDEVQQVIDYLRKNFAR